MGVRIYCPSVFVVCSLFMGALIGTFLNLMTVCTLTATVVPFVSFYVRMCNSGQTRSLAL